MTEQTTREVILHVADDPADIQRALDAAEGLASTDASLQIRVIVNGAALAGLIGHDVIDVPTRTEVSACRVGLAKRNTDLADLRPAVHTVSSAVSAIVAAQLNGAAYVRI